MVIFFDVNGQNPKQFKIQFQVQFLDIEVEDDTYKGMPFVLLSGEKWINNNGSNFYVEFDGGKKQIQKVTAQVVIMNPFIQFAFVYVTLLYPMTKFLHLKGYC